MIRVWLDGCLTPLLMSYDTLVQATAAESKCPSGARIQTGECGKLLLLIQFLISHIHGWVGGLVVMDIMVS